jgi:hypothetical protein
VLGSRTGTIILIDNVGNSPQTAALSGTGVVAVAVAPASLAFGKEALNATSTPRTATITNNSQIASINIASINATGDFAVAANSCASILAPKANCTLTLTFTPTALGTRSGMVTISDDGANSPQTIALSGSGAVPVAVSPANLGFGSQALNTASLVRSIAVRNDNQTTSLNIAGISTTGDFSISGNNCGLPLAALASCTLNLTFTPTALGTRAGTLIVNDDSSSSPQTVTLSGTGAVPVAVSPANLGFGSQALTSASVVKTVTITNHQDAGLNISSAGITGDFTIAGNGCGTMLAARSSCTITVVFSPATLGNRTGSVSSTDDANNSPQSCRWQSLLSVLRLATSSSPPPPPPRPSRSPTIRMQLPTSQA